MCPCQGKKINCEVQLKVLAGGRVRKTKGNKFCWLCTLTSLLKSKPNYLNIVSCATKMNPSHIKMVLSEP